MQSFVSEKTQSYQQLFDEMMNRFNLEAKKTAEQAKVSEVMLSRFRRGKADLGASKLIALLLAIPVEARVWYLSELFGQRTGISLRSLIAEAPPEEQAEVLRLIADIFVNNSREATDPVQLLKAL
ncbi:Lambda repressor-like, DNA-binding domain [Nostoc flagelliforme CCNUN1]|uniref:Lambda repressor-like, DNA-binding domain n=1 Tax=Nostoc flagelliforme CCNUN1 TaxID=2038116 RepID=A0A2K8T2N4_9NOSO|nr:transcriptional regulator [Nostoc flagelliforme]AUB41880.1 Lambda repressor-like, DNA-binding domain [Nostoc flagelliforme CCNUN1]